MRGGGLISSSLGGREQGRVSPALAGRHPTGAEVLLGRLRETLGSHPTGATLWLPDGKDMTLKSALRRVAKAFTDANREGSPLLWSHG